MSFANEIRGFVVKTQAKTDQAVRSVVFSVMESIDRMSPVGNPKLWESLQPYNRFMSKSGKKRLVRPKLEFKRKPPKGYVGGHFRANWQLGIGVCPTSIIPGHNWRVALAREKAKMPKNAGGKVYYYANNVPYAIALEEGHSKKQAPRGMVGITALNFGGYVADAAAEVNK